MEDAEKRQFGELTVTIDRGLCCGYGICIDVAPEIFEFDDEEIVTFKGGSADREKLIEACRSCPVDALVVEKGDETLVP